jgi:hypothetical protein
MKDKKICIKENTFRYQNDDMVIFYDPEDGLMINSRNKNQIDLVKNEEFITESLKEISEYLKK